MKGPEPISGFRPPHPGNTLWNFRVLSDLAEYEMQTTTSNRENCLDSDWPQTATYGCQMSIAWIWDGAYPEYWPTEE